MAKQTAKVRLTRSIVVDGEHAEKGSVHDLPAHIAQARVGEGSAEFVEEADRPTTVNRIASPSNADPDTSKASEGPAPKVVKK